ncbi:hypothetical protein CGRA01v4_03174 [Colletotrichum graminicola]|nr:hypothetical protein CGRA01v4_03174 [Colletotrichum graminicola]
MDPSRLNLELAIERLSERSDRVANNDVDSPVVVISHADRVAASQVLSSSSSNRFLVIPQAYPTVATHQVVPQIVLVGRSRTTGLRSLNTSAETCQAGWLLHSFFSISTREKNH